MTDVGLLAEFADAHAFEEAVEGLWRDGLRRLEVFTPYPISSVVERIHPRPVLVTRIAGIGAIVGVTGGYVLQWYLNAVEYPLDVGGRPLHAVPAFIPITFEMGVLFTALSVFVAALVMSDMPRLWRPVFDVDGFERASIDRFFVLVSCEDPRFDWVKTRSRLRRFSPLRVVEAGRRLP